MGRLIGEHDWSATALGPMEEWPASLRTAVGIMLAARYPIPICWGPDFIQLYNDAYRPVLGATKHPGALGQSTADCFPEIWEHIGPMFRAVLREGEPIGSEDAVFFLHRYGFLEETFFTFSYSPIPRDDGGVGGVFVTCQETTDRVLAHRRLETLQSLAHAVRDAPDQQAVIERALGALAASPKDVPCAAVVRRDSDGAWAVLASAGFAGGAPGVLHLPSDLPVSDPAAWGVAMLDAPRLGLPALAPAPWPEPLREAGLMPLRIPGEPGADLCLLAGFSPRRRVDEAYLHFMRQAAGEIVSAIAAARAAEMEKRRLQELAALDRAKTAFFNNVSHEFRTPMTLMLGPLEDLLEGRTGTVAPAQQEAIDTAHRNCLRLLKLVNSLLDFSRLEAGRLKATYEPVDLAALTADIAGVFRSVIERGGLGFRVECAPMPGAAYVDRDLWERIVLNLLSNAFKFTLRGEIVVTLREVDGRAELAVRDTGVGIPESEIGQVFQRFHRVAETRGRSVEGSGIGLSLVEEMARMHGGTVAVTSRPGEGSEFTVTVPLGRQHLPADRVREQPADSGPLAARTAFVEEARRWLAPSGSQSPVQAPESAGAPVGELRAKQPLVLVADDNADLREYLTSLLAPRFRVVAVADGVTALEAALREGPDLVLADVMMPGLDGFALLRALRIRTETATIPLILLSARAGEESRIEGLEAGADDYLVKPFGARELQARVESQLRLANLRREAELRERALREQVDRARRQVEGLLRGIRDGFVSFDREWRYTYVNERAEELIGRTADELLGRCIWELYPEAAASPLRGQLREVLVGGQAAALEYLHEPWGRWFEIRAYPTGEGVSMLFSDITERKETEALREGFVEQLETRVRERTSEVAAANEQLRGEIEVRRSTEAALQDFNARLLELTEAVQQLTEARDLASVFAVARRAARRLAGADGVTVVLREGDQCHYATEEAIGPLWQGRRFPMSACISGWVMEHRQPAVIEDVRADSRIPQEAYRPTFVRSLAMVPLVVGQPLGALGCYWARVHRASTRDVQLLELLGDAVARAIDRIRLAAELAERLRAREVAEAALRQSERVYRELVDLIPLAVYTCDGEGRITQCNRRAVELWGRPPGEDDRYCGSPRLLGPDGAALSPEQSPMADTIRTGREHRHVEVVIQRPDGTRAVVLAHTAVRRGETGQPVGAVICLLDITEQKRLEEVFERFFNHAATLNCVTDREGRLLRANPNCAELTGRSLPRLIGRSILDFLHADDRKAAEAEMARLNSGATVTNAEARVRTRDGSVRWVLWSGVMVPEAGLVLLSGQDVTERRRIQENLRASERRMQTFLHFNPAVIFIKDRDGRYVQVNRAFLERFGLEETEVIGRTDTEIFPAGQADAFMANDRQVLSEGEAQEFEETARYTDGEHVSLVAKFPLRDARGRLYGLGGIATDITEERRAAERVRDQARFVADVLDSLTARVAVIDREGRILAVNEAWRRFAQEAGAADANGYAGWNYLAVCRAAGSDGAAAAEGIGEVLAGRRAEFQLEYPCHGPAERHWFVVRVAPLAGAISGAVVTHEDITLRRRVFDAVRTIAQGVASHSGEAFLTSLMSCLAEALHVEHALVGELIPGRDRIRVVAAHSLGPLAPGVEYDLAGTPCENVVGRELCHYGDGVAERFPGDKSLQDWGIRSYVGTPLFDSRKRPLGLIALLSTHPLRDPDLIAAMLQIAATRVAGEVERLNAERELRDVAGRLVRAQDYERRILGRELHDSTAQGLAALEINLGALGRHARRLPAAARRVLKDATDLASQCTREIRTLAYSLRPPLLDELGLVAALRVLVQGFALRSGIACRFSGPRRLPTLGREEELALYRIAQEALANVHRHSGSSMALVRLRAADGEVSLTVSDRGRGIPREVVEQVEQGQGRLGIGLAGMAERVRQLGGGLRLHSGPRGTRITASLPCPREAQ